MKIKFLSFLLLFLTLPHLNYAQAQSFIDLAGLSPSTHYLHFQTTHFEITYAEGYFSFAEKAAIHLEHAHTVLSPLLKWQPRQKTSILITDNEDDANGFTAPSLRIGIALIATPPDFWFPTAYTDDWIKLLAFHEYTHFLNIDPTTGWIEALRIIFGDGIRPNGIWPTWMLEGLAVYFETRTSHFGRGRSPYWDSILRALVLDQKLGTSTNNGVTLDRVNGNYPFFPGGDVAYLFGYQLWNQFSKNNAAGRNDAEKKMGEYSYRSSHRFPFFIEGNLKNITHKNWKDYWQSFVDETTESMTGQINALKAKGETPFETITHSRYSSLGGVISPNGKTLAFTESSLDHPQSLCIVDLETQKLTRLENKIMGLGMAFTPDSRFLIFSSFQRNGFETFSEIFSYDLIQNKLHSLSQKLRAKDPNLSPDGSKITFIQSFKGTHLLKIANLSYSQNGVPELSAIETLYTPKEFSILGSPHFNGNSSVVFSLQEIGKGQSDILQISTQGTPPTLLVSNGKMNRYPVSFADKIYFISDLSGIENIYELDLKKSNSPVAITRVLTGAAAPFLSPSGEIYSSLMTGNGYEIVKFKSPAPLQLEANANTIAKLAPEPLISALKSPDLHLAESNSEEYSSFSSLLPRQWAPLAYGDYSSNSGLSFGGLLLGFDTTGKQQYSLQTTYNTKSETVDINAEYSFYYFRPKITLSANTQTSNIGTDVDHSYFQRNEEVALQFQYPIYWTFSQLQTNLYTVLDWNQYETLNGHQRLNSSDYEYQDKPIPAVGLSLQYSNLLGSKLAFSPEEGFTLGLTQEVKFKSTDQSIYKYLASLSTYHRLGGEHSILKPSLRWLGSTLPISGNDNSYSILQGRSSNSITDRGGKVSLGGIGLRGYSNISYLTRSTGILGLDYRFPLNQIYTGFGTLPLFFKQLYGFAFTDTAFIPSSRYGNLFLPSYGFGLSLDTTLLIRVPLTFSVEIQNGTNKKYGADESIFFSIQSPGVF